AGLFQHRFERYAAPLRIAHVAIAALPAADARDEESAAVAGALVHRDDFDGVHFLQLRQAQIERLFDVAFHREAEGVGVYRKRDVREVVADEEGVVRRDDALIENGERRFELRRAAGLEDERA